MIKKTLCFSNKTRLSLKLGQLVIQLTDASGEISTTTRPIEDIGVIILESHDISITSALMAYLMMIKHCLVFQNPITKP